MELVWRELFRVRFYDVDARGRVTLPALCRFLQVAADQHARSGGASMDHLQAAGRMWILAELTLRVQSLSTIDESLVVETWGSSRMSGARAYRDFLILNETEQLLASASTLWLYLDAATRRPLRLPDSVMAFRVDQRDPVLLQAPEPVDGAGAIESETAVRVGWQDLDQNGHTNNIRYLEWALAAVPVDVWENHEPAAVVVRFRNETRLGDVLRCIARVSNGQGGVRIDHEILGEGERTVVTVSTEWRRPAHAAMS
jgi:acyl-CoA thioesterase FadM